MSEYQSLAEEAEKDGHRFAAESFRALEASSRSSSDTHAPSNLNVVSPLSAPPGFDKNYRDTASIGSTSFDSAASNSDYDPISFFPSSTSPSSVSAEPLPPLERTSTGRLGAGGLNDPDLIQILSTLGEERDGDGNDLAQAFESGVYIEGDYRGVNDKEKLEEEDVLEDIVGIFGSGGDIGEDDEAAFLASLDPGSLTGVFDESDLEVDADTFAFLEKQGSESQDHQQSDESEGSALDLQNLSLGDQLSNDSCHHQAPTICLPCATSPSPGSREEVEVDILKEQRNALLALSAIGRRKLGRIPEEEETAGRNETSLIEETVDKSKPEEASFGIGLNRLAYELDSVDVDLVPLPEDLLLDPNLRLLSDIEQQLQKPPDFEEKFEAAVMDHMAASSEDDGEVFEGSEGGMLDVEIDMSEMEPMPDKAKQDMRYPHAGTGVSVRASKNIVAFRSSVPYAQAFGVSESDEATETPKNERSCIGHREKIFGLSFSPCGLNFATASEDSTVKIWNAEKNRCVDTLHGHSKNHEVLRIAWASPSWGKTTCCRGVNGDQGLILGTAGADGVLKIWHKSKSMTSWTCIVSKDHIFESKEKESDKRNLEEGEEDKSKLTDEQVEDMDKETPQIYALQFIDRWNCPTLKASIPGMSNDGASTDNIILTSCDDCVYLWSVATKSKSVGSSADVLEFDLSEFMILRFVSADFANGGVSFRMGTEYFEASAGQAAGPDSGQKTRFGGPRNPDNVNYVFDASYSASSGLLGVALSDGTLRLMNPRGVCISILSLPGCESHLTSFSWDSSGTRLVSCVATGHLVLWAIDSGDVKGNIQVKCSSVLCGGHDMGRPIFGAKYFHGQDENLLLSWGVDGRLCLWDSNSEGEIHRPIATLISKSDYPIYAADVCEEGDNKKKPSLTRIALGGGAEGGFLGISAFVYDINEQEGVEGHR